MAINRIRTADSSGFMRDSAENCGFIGCLVHLPAKSLVRGNRPLLADFVLFRCAFYWISQLEGRVRVPLDDNGGDLRPSRVTAALSQNFSPYAARRASCWMRSRIFLLQDTAVAMRE